MKKRFVFLTNSVRHSITFAQLLTAVLTISIITILMAYFYNNIILKNAIQDAAVKTSLIEKNLATLTNEAENYSRIFSFNSTLQDQLEMLNKTGYSDPVLILNSQRIIKDVAADVTFPNTNIFGAGVIGNRSVLTGSFGNDYALEKVFTDDFCNYVVKSQKPVWTSLVSLPYYSVENKNVFIIAKSVINKNTGRSIGITALYFPESEISSAFSHTDEKFLVVDSSGTIVSSESKEQLYTSLTAAYPDLALWPLDDISAKGYEIIKINNDSTLVTVRNFHTLNWYIISLVPLSNVRTAGISIAFLSFLIILLFSIPVYLFSNRFLHKQITLPVQNFLQTMEQIEAGELDARIHNKSQNEFGKLSEGFNSLMDKMQILMQDIKEKEAIRRETKLKLLQNQINPHFLYNTIETIISCVRLNLLDQSIGVAQSLARFYRISLSQGTDIISLDEEFKLTNYYLSILKIRHVEYLDYRIRLDDNLGFVKIPKLTLQPLVENAVKHGLKSVEEQGFISVTGTRQGQFVIIEVFDNGCGIPQQKIQELYEEINSEEKSLGIGIKNVAARLMLLYGNQFEMEIESIMGSYSKFIIKIRLEEEKDA